MLYIKNIIIKIESNKLIIHIVNVDFNEIILLTILGIYLNDDYEYASQAYRN